MTLVARDQAPRLDLESLVTQSDPKALVYACGPDRMLTSLEELLGRRGEIDRLRTERFEPVELGDTADEPFEIEVASSGEVIPVAGDETALDALERAGVYVPYSCREGTCGTCEVAVAIGIPEHRDSILTERERRANDVMYPCVSRAVTPRLTLDL
ncbi:iron-sulfur cluster-binding domain-containing protein [Microbacterium sp. UBA3394]|uniref:flavin reductase family protein n=1 Tax=Microbacterium sp. UBA3394 TaxID=1946945 RepID=UPI000C41C9BB|nr:iron-sulfur cluster-binding domain-containing protein [Microbacterium sp. UBA3394]EED6225543.1 2Fe-2S iron-sulfur cluster binding domain-containing protein [Salmonella enterica subsp. enterica serovar Haifa]MAB20309.1 hypothetical protein [Microbacterium sp.]